MNILLADDQFDVRCALKCLFESEVDLHVAGEASSSAELLAQVALACPDLVLFDWELPTMIGHDLVLTLRALCPPIRLIALSVRPEARDEALRAGAQSFVSKGDPPEKLLAALRKFRVS